MTSIHIINRGTNWGDLGTTVNDLAYGGHIFALDQQTLKANRPAMDDRWIKYHLVANLWSDITEMFSLELSLHFIHDGALYKIGPYQRGLYYDDERFMESWRTLLAGEQATGNPIDYLKIWELLSI